VLTLIASEDQEFFEHHGVDLSALSRAAWLNATREERYGGSTLTMQLGRILRSQGKPRTLWRKLNEIMLAWRLERALNKQAILEHYLNRVYYGHGAYGIEAAAQRYFGKPAAALSAGEATLLCVLPRNPSYYDPIAHPERIRARRNHLLALLLKQHRIDPAAARRARQQDTRFALHALANRAPHVVDWVLRELPEELRIRGGRVRTCIDLALQQSLEHRVKEHVKNLARYGVQQAGVVVLDSQSGELLAMVGSSDYDSSFSGQLNITTWRRHPGSALKPFVYATAIEHGASPTSIAYDVYDVPSSYRVRGTPPVEHGPTRYREALAGSYNLAAVHVLEQVGVARVLDRLKRAGVGLLPGDVSDYGLRLALGATKVRLIDLALAYGVFVRQGRVTDLRTVLQAQKGDGSLIALGSRRREKHVFSPQAAWLTMDMLSDPEARRPLFGDDLPADLPFRVVAKTGTARGFSDNLAVFATRELTVAAWSGRFDGAPTRGMRGMEGAGPLARTALLAASRGRRLSLPLQPNGLVKREVCPLSGLLPSRDCPHRKLDYFIQSQVPKQTCDWHHREGGFLHVRYPPELKSWADRHRQVLSSSLFNRSFEQLVN